MCEYSRTISGQANKLLHHISTTYHDNRAMECLILQRRSKQQKVLDYLRFNTEAHSDAALYNTVLNPMTNTAAPKIPRKAGKKMLLRERHRI